MSGGDGHGVGTPGVSVLDALVAVARDGLGAGRGAGPDPATIEMVDALEAAGGRAALVRGVARERLAGVLTAVDEARGRPLDPILEGLVTRDRVVRLRCASALETAAGALDEAGVPWLVVKGPAIARLWPRPEQRGANDLDVLVDPAAVGGAVAALVGAGAREINRNWEAVLRYGVAEFPLVLGGVQIDLHADLVGLGRHRRHLRLDTGGILARSRRVDVGPTTVPIADPADQLLHLCVHTGLGGATRLSQLRDVAAAVRGDPPEPSVFVERARSAGAMGMCAHVLDRVGEVFGMSGSGTPGSGVPGPSGRPGELVGAPGVSGSGVSWFLGRELALRRRHDRRCRRRARGTGVGDTGGRIGAAWWVRSRRDTVGATVGEHLWWSWRWVASRLGIPVTSWDVDDPTSPLYWGHERGGDEARHRYLTWLAGDLGGRAR